MIRKNLIGQKFSRLTVISLSEIKNKKSYWLCSCECGKEKVVMGTRLAYGSTKSCGCMQIEKRTENRRSHGLSKKNEYQIWLKIKGRCYSESNPAFRLYGARGIRLSEDWLDFENFYRDMAPRPSLKHSLDRIDCNKGYSKDNCRWATSKQQNNNRRNNVRYSVNGVEATLSEHCDRYGKNYKLTHQRMSRGHDVMDALGLVGSLVEPQVLEQTL